MRLRELGHAAAATFALAAACVAGDVFHASFDTGFDGVSPAGVVAAEVTGDAALVEGRQGKAVFLPEGACLTYAAKGALDRDEGTISFWIKPAWGPSDRGAHFLVVDALRALKFFRHSDGRLHLQMERKTGARSLAMSGAIWWRQDTWRNVKVAWKRALSADADTVVAVEVDGQPVAWASERMAPRPAGDSFTIGADQKKSFLNATIDEFRVSDRAEISLEKPASLPMADGTPTDDPYISDTAYLPPDMKPDPIHRLDAVAATMWGAFPTDLAEEYFGDSAAQRVIYRDTVTGAEVWLTLRTPAEEGIQYTNYRPFNADGSMMRVWGVNGFVRADGSGFQSFAKAIPHEFSGLPEWDKRNPDVVLCRTANGGSYRFNLRTRQREDIFTPGASVPDHIYVHFSDDEQHSLFISRQGTKPPFKAWLGDGRGQGRREVEVRTVSPEPAQDRMGSAAFLRDQRGKLYFRYSINKGKGASGPTPYQNWLVEMDGSAYRRMNSQSELLDDPELHFVPAGSFTVTGHGGYSPSMKLFAHHSGKPGYKWVRDQATWRQRELARIPGCDHMDWTCDENWFLVWTVQKGVPIYKVYVDTGVTERIVASNSCSHTSAGVPYHGASPDGTKMAFRSEMLGGQDYYVAIMRHPEPPVNVSVKREQGANVLAWAAPSRSAEIASFNVYRSDRSGLGWRRVNKAPVTGMTWRDEGAPERAFYALTSVENCGLESRVYSNQAALDWKAEASVFWEAESGALKFPMREVFLPAECSANHGVTRAVRDPLWIPAEGAGEVEWSVNLPRGGAWFLWARARSRAGGEAPMGFDVEGAAATAKVGEKAWAWTRVGGPYELAAGARRVRGTMPASGLEVDKLLLTTDATLSPKGMGDWPEEAPARPEGLEVAWDKGGEMALLRWKGADSPLFHHYQVYRGASADFVPDAPGLVGSPTRPCFIDPGAQAAERAWYRVVCVDTWGNASAASAAVAAPTRARPPRVDLLMALDKAAVSGGAAILEDAGAKGGKAPVFGEPDKVVENAGEASLPVSLPPGKYFVWLRIRGDQLKPAVFCWVGLGENSFYTRLYTTGRQRPQWEWVRVMAIKSVMDPDTRPALYEVKTTPAPLTIKHRANHFAVDQVFITNDVSSSPMPGSFGPHPGCDKAFKRP